MDNKEILLNRRINELLYHFEARDYDKRHPETMVGDRLWWEDFGKKYIKEEQVGLRILDVGTGTGLVPLCLRKYLKDPDDFVCYDISEGMLKQAQEKLEGNFYFIRGDVGVLPFANEVFDVVVFNSLLHHLLNYGQFLKECNRVLKKNGIIAFAHEPNKRFLESKLCWVLSTLYNCLCPIDLTEELRQKVNNGLKKENLIDKDFSKEEIRRLVEFHSPMEQSRFRIDRSKGFMVEELIRDNLNGYTILEISEYSTYFHRPFFEKAKVISLAMKLVKNVILKRDNLFRAVLQK